jgi:hypothetical protein
MTPPVLRPLSLGEILDVSFGLYRTLFLPLLMVTLALQGLPVILSIYVEASGGITANIGLWALAGFLSMLGSALASASSTFILSEHYMGRTITAGDAISRAMPFVGRVVVLTLLTALVAGFGTVLLIIPGLILFTGLVLAPVALVIEGRPFATDAMGRAWALSRGHRWKLFGCLVVTFIIILLPIIALGTGSILTMDVDTQQSAVSSMGIAWLTAAQALQLLAYPLLYCVLTVSYYDLRVRKEAFDLEILAGGLAKA